MIHVRLLLLVPEAVSLLHAVPLWAKLYPNTWLWQLVRRRTPTILSLGSQLWVLSSPLFVETLLLQKKKGNGCIRKCDGKDDTKQFPSLNSYCHLATLVSSVSTAENVFRSPSSGTDKRSKFVCLHRRRSEHVAWGAQTWRHARQGKQREHRPETGLAASGSTGSRYSRRLAALGLAWPSVSRALLASLSYYRYWQHLLPFVALLWRHFSSSFEHEELYAYFHAQL